MLPLSTCQQCKSIPMQINTNTVSLSIPPFHSKKLPSSDVYKGGGSVQAWHMDCTATARGTNEVKQIYPVLLCPRHSSTAAAYPGGTSPCRRKWYLLWFNKLSQQLGQRHVKIHVLKLLGKMKIQRCLVTYQSPLPTTPTGQRNCHFMYIKLFIQES